MSVKTARGFGLVEVMIALAILAIGLVVTVPLLSYGIQRGASARKLTSAQLLGNQVLERLRTEVRYDAEPSVTATGVDATSGTFDLANAWRAERLPYLSSETLNTAEAGVSLTSCNPSGAADGATYKVGPWRVRYEGSEFFVCYRIAPSTRTDVPPHSVEATIKVIWHGSNGGWAARWVSGLLLSGA